MFTDITAPIDVLRAGNPNFKLKSDQDLIELEYEGAFRRLKLDLISILSIFENTDTILDQIYSNNEDQLRTALAYKQLELFYFGLFESADSPNYAKQVHYERLYNELKNTFGNMIVKIPNKTNIVRFLR